MPGTSLVPYSSDEEEKRERGRAREKASGKRKVKEEQSERQERPSGRPTRNSQPPLDPLDEWFLNEEASPPSHSSATRPLSHQPPPYTAQLQPFHKVAKHGGEVEVENSGFAIPTIPEELLRKRPGHFMEEPPPVAWPAASSSSSNGGGASGTVDSFLMPSGQSSPPTRRCVLDAASDRRPSPERARGRAQQPRVHPPSDTAARQPSPPEDFKPSFAGLLERCGLGAGKSLDVSSDEAESSRSRGRRAGANTNADASTKVVFHGFLHPFTPELDRLNRPVRCEKVQVKRIHTPWDHPCIHHFGLFVMDGCSLEAGEEVMCYAGQATLGNSDDGLADCIAPLVEPEEPGGPCCQVSSQQWGNEARFINDYRLVQERPNCWVDRAVRYDETGLPYRMVTAREAIAGGQELVMDYGINFWDVALAVVRNPKVVVQPNEAVEWPLPVQRTSCVLWDQLTIQEVKRFARPQRMSKVNVRQDPTTGNVMAVAAEAISRSELVGTLGGRLLAPFDVTPPGATVYRLVGELHEYRVQAENEVQWFQDCSPAQANCVFHMMWGATGRFYLAITASTDIPKGDVLRMSHTASQLQD